MKPQKPTKQTSVIYFQIGLIVALLFSIVVIETKSEAETIAIGTASAHDISEEPPFVFTPPKQKAPKIVDTKIPKKKISKALPIEPTDPEDEFTEIFNPPAGEVVDTIVTPQVFTPTIETPIDVPIFQLEEAPVFPGCENISNQVERKICFSESISKFVYSKFDTDIASDLNLKGENRIYTTFKVDSSGEVVDIKVSSPHQALDEEAKRVLYKLPKMKPGKQNGKPVNVLYSLPIIFEVR
ncbi:energy transducer TonB [Mesonia sp. K7]|uniref:energy transducer TonB n=1 Tax=Mesonia sp. K7 TaxID=2218606 RepID=UPI000DAA0F1C|nr:energy transducer TonB [Mesonia sp. K7]PZD78760.1 energy transducer TonB [Mesonia sp. K7]